MKKKKQFGSAAEAYKYARTIKGGAIVSQDFYDSDKWNVKPMTTGRIK